VVLDDAVTLAPFVAAILLAVAILFVDFIAPGRKGPALLVTFAGLALVAALVSSAGRRAGT
jgi:hypothetical protein